MQDFMQDVNRENSSNFISEADEDGERDLSRTAALSVPLAAIRFVTRLASGIFSRGQRSLDHVHVPSNGVIECLSPVNVCETSSQECIAIDGGDNSVSKIFKIEESVIPGGSENVEASETLCSLKNEDAPASCDDDACSLKHFDMVTDPLDHYYIGANGQVLLLLPYF